MKLSVLAKAIGAGVISFNLATLPLLLPASAQTTTAPSGSSTGSAGNSTNTNTGSSNTVDPNINPDLSNNTVPSTSTTGTGSNTGSTITGTTTAPGSSMSGGSNNAGTSTTGTSPDIGDPTSADNAPASSSSTGSSTASSEPNTTTEPSHQTTSTRENHSNWGWLGLLGLIGLASLFRKPTRSSVDHKHMQTQLNSANDRIEKGVAQAGEGLGNFIDELKTDVSDFKERRAKAKEIKQIKNALGRPSTRVILDRQDNVILNVGDLITNQAIERARTADMLDVLLDSVDEQQPAIDDEERSAPVPGEASLEEQESRTAINNRRI